LSDLEKFLDFWKFSISVCPEGSFPMFDAANHPFFFGYVPHADTGSQPLYPFSLPDQYYGHDYNGLGQDFALGEKLP
jgi:hypothetical protein